jgi:hypothetical protein
VIAEDDDRFDSTPKSYEKPLAEHCSQEIVISGASVLGHSLGWQYMATFAKMMDTLDGRPVYTAKPNNQRLYLYHVTTNKKTVYGTDAAGFWIVGQTVGSRSAFMQIKSDAPIPDHFGERRWRVWNTDSAMTFDAANAIGAGKMTKVANIVTMCKRKAKTLPPTGRPTPLVTSLHSLAPTPDLHACKVLSFRPRGVLLDPTVIPAIGNYTANGTYQTRAVYHNCVLNSSESHSFGASHSLCSYLYYLPEQAMWAIGPNRGSFPFWFAVSSEAIFPVRVTGEWMYFDPSTWGPKSTATQTAVATEQSRLKCVRRYRQLPTATPTQAPSPFPTPQSTALPSWTDSSESIVTSMPAQNFSTTSEYKSLYQRLKNAQRSKSPNLEVKVRADLQRLKTAFNARNGAFATEYKGLELGFNERYNSAFAKENYSAALQTEYKGLELAQRTNNPVLVAELLAQIAHLHLTGHLLDPTTAPTPSPAPGWGTHAPTSVGCTNIQISGLHPDQSGYDCMGVYRLQPSTQTTRQVYMFAGQVAQGKKKCFLFYASKRHAWAVGSKVGQPPYDLMVNAFADSSAASQSGFNYAAGLQSWQVYNYMEARYLPGHSVGASCCVGACAGLDRLFRSRGHTTPTTSGGSVHSSVVRDIQQPTSRDAIHIHAELKVYCVFHEKKAQGKELIIAGSLASALRIDQDERISVNVSSLTMHQETGPSRATFAKKYRHMLHYREAMIVKERALETAQNSDSPHEIAKLKQDIAVLQARRDGDIAATVSLGVRSDAVVPLGLRLSVEIIVQGSMRRPNQRDIVLAAIAICKGLEHPSMPATLIRRFGGNLGWKACKIEIATPQLHMHGLALDVDQLYRSMTHTPRWTGIPTNHPLQKKAQPLPNTAAANHAANHAASNSRNTRPGGKVAEKTASLVPGLADSTLRVIVLALCNAAVLFGGLRWYRRRQNPAYQEIKLSTRLPPLGSSGQKNTGQGDLPELGAAFQYRRRNEMR